MTPTSRTTATRPTRPSLRGRRLRLAQVGLAAALIATAALSGCANSSADPGNAAAKTPDTKSPAAGAATDTGWAVASGTTVQLGSGKTVDLHRPVGFLYQTSAGVLVMFGSGNAPWGGSRRYALLSDDGATRTDFTIPVDDIQPGTDPTQPYVVYAQATDSPTTWDLVVRDLRVNKVVDTIPVEGSYTWTDKTPEGVPDVFLSGSHVYISFDDTAVSVDLETRDVTPNDVLPASEVLYIAGGKAGSFGDMTFSDDHTIEHTWQIVDIATGDVVLKSDGPDERLVTSVSPDGSHAIVSAGKCTGSSACDKLPSTAFIYNLDTGDHVELDAKDALLSWTTAGSVLRVTPTAGTVDVCGADSATCESTKLEVGHSDVQLTDAMNW